MDKPITPRQTSTVEYFNRLADRLPPPALSFRGSTKVDWERWRAAFGAKLLELCGEWPQRVPLNPETIYRVETDDGLILEKVIYNTETDFSVPAYVLIPKDTSRAKGGKLPAILTLHGHGKWAKDGVAGVICPDNKDMTDSVRRANYDYGRQMARNGYITISIDARGFGELGDGPMPFAGREIQHICDTHFLRGLLLGFNFLTLNIWDMMRTVDYLQTRADVDGDRIGAMGLSYGGTRTTYLAALDERIKAADIICYMTCFRDYAIADANFCGSQFLPHQFRWGDVPDVAGLIAPRPLLVESGVHDTCFPIGPVMRAHEHLRRIYAAAGCADKLTVDLFEGGHQFHGPSAFAFFEKWL